jgi:disulfide bond formation protein DsbB
MTSIAELSRRARRAPLSAAALIISLAAAATLAGAWFFEFVLKLEPCPLCLDQRIPYYVAVPLGLVVGWLALAPSRAAFARIGFAFLGLVMLVGAGYGVYHAGIEWGFWQGPASCAGGGRVGSGDILSQLRSTVRVVPCNEAAWRFLGISLAGYNVLIAGALAALAFWAAFAKPPRST